VSALVGTAVPAAVCRLGLCCPGVERCLSGVNTIISVYDTKEEGYSEPGECSREPEMYCEGEEGLRLVTGVFAIQRSRKCSREDARSDHVGPAINVLRGRGGGLVFTIRRRRKSVHVKTPARTMSA